MTDLRLSFSSISTFKQCPKRWKFRYIDKLPDPPGYPAILGSFVHLILEDFYKLDPFERDEENAKTIARKIWDEFSQTEEFLSIVGDDEAELKTFRQKAWVSTTSIWEFEDPQKVNVISTEAPFTLEFEEARVVGYIDRVEAKNGKYEIADYKGLALDTPIPTPDGWTTMGELKIGDKVFGSNGKPCEVAAVSSIHLNPTYRIFFDDKSELVADEDHRWLVRNSESHVEKVLTTKEISENLFGKNNQRCLSIVNPAPLDLPIKDLPIDPYVLGVWLGNGRNSEAVVTVADPWIFDEVRSRGFAIGNDISSKKNGWEQRTIYNLTETLEKLGLLGNKHIPPMYLRSSLDQRLDLLRGLMDFTGCWKAVSDSCSFSSQGKELADGFMELCASLGWKTSPRTNIVKRSGEDITSYYVDFIPYSHNPFLLPRKAEKVKLAGTLKSCRRLIVKVEKIATTETQCITVNSDDNTYLCGKEMITTHNTGKAPMRQYQQDKKLQLLIYGLAVAEGTSEMPSKGKLMYLGSQIVSETFSEAKFTQVTKAVTSTAVAIGKAKEEGFEASVGPLCAWCSYVDQCTEGQNEIEWRFKEGKIKKKAPGYALAKELAGRIL